MSFTRPTLPKAQCNAGAMNMSSGVIMAELKPVQRGERWRVEMSWPGYNARSIGEFDSEAEAAAWIKRHSWLAPEPKTSAALPVPKSSSES